MTVPDSHPSSPEDQKKVVEDLTAECAELTKALTGLTCNGSEFFIRKGGRYTADIKACVEWIRRSKESAHQRTVEAIRARNAAEATLKELEKERDLADTAAASWKADAATEFLARQRAEQERDEARAEATRWFDNAMADLQRKAGPR